MHMSQGVATPLEEAEQLSAAGHFLGSVSSSRS